MNDKMFYCPLYEGNINKFDCDELCMGADFNHFKYEDAPHLMTIEEIGKKYMVCVKCQITKNTTYSSNPKVQERIKALEEKYKDDTDALEQIERSKIGLAYLEQKAIDGNYQGQTPLQYIMSLEEHLSMWN